MRQILRHTSSKGSHWNIKMTATLIKDKELMLTSILLIGLVLNTICKTLKYFKRNI